MGEVGREKIIKGEVLFVCFLNSVWSGFGGVLWGFFVTVLLFKDSPGEQAVFRIGT